MNGRATTTATVLNQRVLLLQPVETRDAVGGVQTAWAEVATTWAGKRFLSGARLYAAEEKQGEDLQVFRIRHRGAVGRFWRLQHGDDVYEITALEEIGSRQFLDLTVRGLNQTAGAGARIRRVVLAAAGVCATVLALVRRVRSAAISAAGASVADAVPVRVRSAQAIANCSSSPAAVPVRVRSGVVSAAGATTPALLPLRVSAVLNSNGDLCLNSDGTLAGSVT